MRWGAIDQLELAQSGAELYHKRWTSQQEALWYPSKRREQRNVHSLLSIHIYHWFLFPPRRSTFWNIFPSFFFIAQVLDLSLSPFVFLLSSISLHVFFPSSRLISILSVRVIDSSCLPLVKMSFIILCDSWLDEWLTKCLVGWLRARQGGHWPICGRYKKREIIRSGYSNQIRTLVKQQV